MIDLHSRASSKPCVCCRLTVVGNDVVCESAVHLSSLESLWTAPASVPLQLCCVASLCSTNMTCVCCRQAEVGIDVVCESATQYPKAHSGTNGHPLMTSSCCSPTDVGFAVGCESAIKYLNVSLNSTMYALCMLQAGRSGR